MSSLYIDLQSISPGYLQLDPVQICEIMSIIERIMRIIVVGLLDTWTYHYKASSGCPVHPEALLRLALLNT